MHSNDVEIIALVQKYGLMVNREKAAEILNLKPYHIDALANKGMLTRIYPPSPKTGEPGKLVRFKTTQVARCL